MQQEKEKTLGPCTLEGKTVRLETLNMEHAGSLLEARENFDWAWMSRDLSTLHAMKAWIAEALEAQRMSQEYPFAVFHKAQERFIGSTRYMDVQAENRGVEIGWTWYSPSVWGTSVNPETKLLLLTHAFENWGALRVQLKTDHNNQHSQNAIVKLGAKFEGQLRNHRIRRDGTIRHTMMYSIIKEEWTTAKSNLIERLQSIR